MKFRMHFLQAFRCRRPRNWSVLDLIFSGQLRRRHAKPGPLVEMAQNHDRPGVYLHGSVCRGVCRGRLGLVGRGHGTDDSSSGDDSRHDCFTVLQCESLNAV